MASDLKVLLGVSVVAAIGVLLNVLASVIYKNYLPLLCLVFYLFAPLPNLICGKVQDDLWDDSNPWETRANFFTSAMVISGFAFPLILLHAGILTGGAVGLSIAGAFICYVAILAYLHFFHKKDDGF